MIKYNIRALTKGPLVEGSLESQVSAEVDLNVSAETCYNKDNDESPSMSEDIAEIGRRVLYPTPITAHWMVPAIE